MSSPAQMPNKITRPPDTKQSNSITTKNSSCEIIEPKMNLKKLKENLRTADAGHHWDEIKPNLNGHWFLTYLSGNYGKTGQICLIGGQSNLPFTATGPPWPMLEISRPSTCTEARVTRWITSFMLESPRRVLTTKVRLLSYVQSENETINFPHWFVLTGFGACDDLGFDDFMNVFTPFILIAGTLGCSKILLIEHVLSCCYLGLPFTFGAIQPTGHFDNTCALILHKQSLGFRI